MGVIKSKQKSREDLKAQIQEFNSRLQVALVKCSQAKTTFITLSEMWCHSRREALSVLHSTADEIDRHHHNVNIASMTGTSSSIAGGTASIGGLILSPFTGGLSLALSAGGLFGTVAGSATTLGASIAEVILTKELVERVNRALETDVFYTKALTASVRELIIRENKVIEILSELQNESLMEDLDKVLKASPCCDEVKKRFCNLRTTPNTLEDILDLVKCLYPEDRMFLQQLSKTDDLFTAAPSLSATLSTSSDFFQAVKELATVGPETLKSISGAALQSTAANSASLGTQVVSVGLGAVFVALDVYNFMKTSKNFDEGSKTELAARMRNAAEQLEKEKLYIGKLNEFYRQHVHLDELNMAF